MTFHSVSVLITVYNRPDHLRLCLGALAGQTVKPAQVVIADDGSDTPVAQALAPFLTSYPLPVQLVHQAHDGYRLAAARNLAIRAATGDYLVSIDCDIALLPDAIERHLRLAAPGAFLVGDRALLGEADSAPLFAAAPTAADWEAAWPKADQTELQLAQRRFVHHDRLRRWGLADRHKPKILGCHFSLPREAAVAVNGFDENFRGWGYEDDDFALRLYKAGFQSRSVILEARAMHLYHPTLKPAGRRHRDRPNRAYFRRWRVPAFCRNGLVKADT